MSWTFRGFETLVAGTGNNWFAGAAGGAVWRFSEDGSFTAHSISVYGMNGIRAGAGTDTIAGPAVDTVWTLDGAGSGHLRFGDGDGSLWRIAFTGVENLSGGADNYDRFLLLAGAALTGRIDGGAGGTDVLVVRDSLFEEVSWTDRLLASGSVTLTHQGLASVIAWSGLERPSYTVRGSGSHLTIRGTGADDYVVLDLHPGKQGRLRLLSLNSYMNDIEFDAPTESLTVHLGAGSDTIIINSYGHGFGASLIIDGGTPGYDGDTVIVEAGAVISTRHLINSGAASVIFADHKSGESIGDSGEIALYAEIIEVRSGAQLLTHVRYSPDGAGNPVFTAGDITLKTRSPDETEVTSENSPLLKSFGLNKISIGRGAVLDASAPTASASGTVTIIAENKPLALAIPFIDVWLPRAEVRIDAAEVRGGDIIIRAVSIAKSPAGIGGVEGDLGGMAAKSFVKGAISTIQQIPGVLLSSLLGGDATVGVRQTAAVVTIIDSDIRAEGDLEVSSMSVSEVKVAAFSATRGLPGAAADSPFQFAFSFAYATVHAETIIRGTTLLQAAGDITLEADAVAKAEAKAKTSNLTELQLSRNRPDRFNSETMSMAIGIGVTQLTSRVQVASGSRVISTGGNVRIPAAGENKSKADAGVTVYVSGRAGITLGLSIAHSAVEALIDGTVHAHGTVLQPDHVFDPSGTDVVDLELNTIKTPGHGLKTGDSFVYRAGSGESPIPIGGLEHGALYFVMVMDSERIQLAELPPIDLALDGVSALSRHSLTVMRDLGFVLNAIDDDENTLRMPGHGFESGWIVVYKNNGHGDIEGLKSGSKYIVDVVDGNRIRLKALNAGDSDPAIGIRQGTALDAHEFIVFAGGAESPDKGYRLVLGRIDPDTDTIHVAGHGLDQALEKSGYWRHLDDSGGIAGLDQNVNYVARTTMKCITGFSRRLSVRIKL